MSADHDDFATEPVWGLPEVPPEGEEILWQGSPSWRGLALHVFHVRAIAVYFGLLFAWTLVSTFGSGAGFPAALASSAPYVLPAALCIGILCVWAIMISRTTAYTITNRRVVMRFGLALTKSINIPFKVITAADLKVLPGGTGDVPLTLSEGERIGYLHLWPHVRPLRLAQPQPMLRAIPQAHNVAAILGRALSQSIDAPQGGRPARAPAAPSNPPQAEAARGSLAAPA